MYHKISHVAINQILYDFMIKAKLFQNLICNDAV